MVAEINAAQEISYILRDPFPVLYFYYPAVFPKILFAGDMPPYPAAWM